MGKVLLIMAKHTFLKKNQNTGWGHNITFYKGPFVWFAWKMTMLLAFPAKRQIYDLPCTLAIKMRDKKMATKYPTLFFEWIKKNPIVWSDNTLKIKRGSGNIQSVDLDCGIQATCPDWKWGKRWPLEPRMKELRIHDYTLLHPRIRLDRSSMK